MKANPIVVIPARMAASRLPGKPLADIAGLPMIVQVWRRAAEADIGPVVVAGGTQDMRHALQAALSDARLRLYRNDDLLGVELCGALKNVMALAAGIAEGLGLGDNTKAAILSRGLVEMRRYGRELGAKDETFFGLAGVGDLAVTAFSTHGRNRAFGERIGRGETLDEILASTQKVAEGVWTSRVVREIIV